MKIILSDDDRVKPFMMGKMGRTVRHYDHFEAREPIYDHLLYTNGESKIYGSDVKDLMFSHFYAAVRKHGKEKMNPQKFAINFFKQWRIYDPPPDLGLQHISTDRL